MPMAAAPAIEGALHGALGRNRVPQDAGLRDALDQHRLAPDVAADEVCGGAGVDPDDLELHAAGVV